MPAGCLLGDRTRALPGQGGKRPACCCPQREALFARLGPGRSCGSATSPPSAQGSICSAAWGAQPATDSRKLRENCFFHFELILSHGKCTVQQQKRSKPRSSKPEEVESGFEPCWEPGSAETAADPVGAAWGLGSGCLPRRGGGCVSGIRGPLRAAGSPRACLSLKTEQLGSPVRTGLLLGRGTRAAGAQKGAWVWGPRVRLGRGCRMGSEASLTRQAGPREAVG